MAYQSLHQRLRGPITKALKDELKVGNVHALPKLEKVIVNVGINKTKMDGKDVQEYVADVIKRITGQKPVFRTARVAISNFKTRKGLIVGAIVTLRGKRMEEFIDRLVSYVLPRIRDFRGLPGKLDGRGNYAIGLRDHTIFPEVPSADAGKIFGMQIQITTTAGNDTAGRALLKQIGMPFTPERASAIKPGNQESRLRPSDLVGRTKAGKTVASAAESHDTALSSEANANGSNSPAAGKHP